MCPPHVCTIYGQKRRLHPRLDMQFRGMTQCLLNSLMIWLNTLTHKRLGGVNRGLSADGPDLPTAGDFNVLLC